MAEPPLCLQDFAAPDALPAPARALFGGDAFSTMEWYRAATAAAIPPGASPCFTLILQENDVLGVVPMLRGEGTLSAFTTPYTALWQPLFAPEATAVQLEAAGRALARHWRRHQLVRLEAIDPNVPCWPPLLAGLATRFRPLRFDHFGNWSEPVAGLRWNAYLAARPSQLRNTITRATRRLMGMPAASFTLVDSPHGLTETLALYEQVYAESWKPPEPFPHFNATLLAEMAQAGTLRLGVLSLDGRPIAAQFWLLHARWASVLKLAHTETHKNLAPGTVLTGLMVRHLLDHDAVEELDFGRGDDAYKRGWTANRAQRTGVLLANPWRPAGLAAIARHAAGIARRRLAPLAARLKQRAEAKY